MDVASKQKKKRDIKTWEMADRKKRAEGGRNEEDESVL